jgi:hypothetical protein
MRSEAWRVASTTGKTTVLLRTALAPTIILRHSNVASMLCLITVRGVNVLVRQIVVFSMVLTCVIY